MSHTTNSGYAGVLLDVHAHYLAEDLIHILAHDGPHHAIAVRDEADGRRRAVLDGRPTGLPFLSLLSDVAARLSWLDGAGIQQQLVSGWMDLAGYHLQRADARWLAHVQNETLAELTRAHPTRFLGAAMVPLQHPEDAAAELHSAVHEQGLVAVQIGTNVEGRGLDEPELDPFWAMAQELDVPIIVHPAELEGQERWRRYFLNILVGNPSETTQAAGALLLGGVLERFPGLRVLLVHGGGFLPYQLGRLSRGFTAAPPNARARTTRPPESFLPSLFFDTVVHSAQALRFLVEVVGVPQVVVGTDYPFPLQDADPRASLGALGHLAEHEVDALLGQNAQRMLKPSSLAAAEE